MSSLQIRDTHDGAQRQSKMCRRHGVHVINLAVRSAPVVIRSAVPTRHSSFFKDRFRAGGNNDLLVLARFGGWRSRDWFFLFLRKRWWGRNRRRRTFVSTTAAQKRAAQ